MPNAESIPDALIASLRQSLLALGEIGGNHLLGYDEIALQACAGLRGRCIAIHITDLEFWLYVHPGEWGIRLGLAQPPREVDATIAGKLGALLSLAATRDKVSTSISEGIVFSGDIGLAQKLQSIFASLDIDWEEMIARRTGDVAAFQIRQGLSAFHQRLVAGADSLMQTSSEYLREESRLTPTQPEFDRFRTDLGELRNAVARAEARFERLLSGRR